MFYTNVCRHKNKLYALGYDDKGKRWKKIIDYQVVLYTRTKSPTAQFNDVLTGVGVQPIVVGSMYEASDFIKRNSGFLEPLVFGSTDYVGSWINQEWPDSVPYVENLIKPLVIDIETSGVGGFATAANPTQSVTAITCWLGGKFYSFGLKGFTPKKKNVTYKMFDSEKTLLDTFLKFWEIADFDVVTGWNSNGYDLPYLLNRCAMLFGLESQKRFSPFNLAPRITDKMNRFGQKGLDVKIPGLSCLDYLDLYRKFVQAQREEYTLNYISEFELGDKKTDYNEYGSLDALYDQNHQLFMEYNVHDVELVVKLDEKLKFLNLAYSIAYHAKVNYELVLGSVAIWENIIRNHLLKKKQVFSVDGNSKQKSKSITGAYVKPIIPGVYKSVVSFDASSLYPSLIRMLNISPETITGDRLDVDRDNIHSKSWEEALKIAKERRVSVAGSGYTFSNAKVGFMAELMEEYYQEKQEASALMLKLQKEYQKTHDPETLIRSEQVASRRSAIKIEINSLYGASSNEYFRFYDDRIAESITLSGQTLIQETARCMNEHLNRLTGIKKDRIVGSDTDSIYVDCSDVTLDTDKLDELCRNDFEPYLEKVMDSIKEKMNCIGPAIQMTREVIADRAMWVAGKNYVIRVVDNKGVKYAKPKYKIMGLQAVRSTTPSIIREYMKGVMPFILESDRKGLNDYIADCRQKYHIAGVREISKTIRYNAHTKVVTQAKKAAELYNATLLKLRLDAKYKLIRSGEKLRLVSLRMPNPMGVKEFGFPNGELPVEFGLYDYIDYDGMFQKYFMDVVDKWSALAQIQANGQESLDSFFN